MCKCLVSGRLFWYKAFDQLFLLTSFCNYDGGCFSFFLDDTFGDDAYLLGKQLNCWSKFATAVVKDIYCAFSVLIFLHSALNSVVKFCKLLQFTIVYDQLIDVQLEKEQLFFVYSPFKAVIKELKIVQIELMKINFNV